MLSERDQTILDAVRSDFIILRAHFAALRFQQAARRLALVLRVRPIAGGKIVATDGHAVVNGKPVRLAARDLQASWNRIAGLTSGSGIAPTARRFTATTMAARLLIQHLATTPEQARS